MVQEQVYASSSYVADPQARKSTYKAMEMGGYAQSSAGKSAGAGMLNKNKKGTDQKDVWGPVFRNKQHFIDMHFC
ncbi:uncharacterized protein [Panulirus ornatus]|uniref:uncharacterized protein n=1 Tax=Panulirus ornatus TaxID=150431 RepID=UPI003A84C8DB